MTWSNGGEFNRLIWCDTAVTAQDSTGDPVVTWTPQFQTWAKVRPLTGREILQAEGINAEMDTRINIRWSIAASAIDATWRLRYGDVIYNISEPPMDLELKHKEIEMLCKSGINEG